MKRCLAALSFAAALATAAAAEYRRVADRAAFLDLVEGRALTRLGIRLTLGADGSIAGSAFGGEVTGNWHWRDGFFCRELFFGARSFAPNCQLVELDGMTLRFTADRGRGDTARLRLQ